MREWWRSAVIYQVYPRSYQDSTGDGVGDLTGITQRLDHIADLGADCIWLSPIFASPQADMGYDVSDYIAVDPLFGDLDAFDALLTGAHDRGLKVIVDQKSLAFLNGTELDFQKEGLNEGFLFRNPNVKDECGCGESFTI